MTGVVPALAAHQQIETAGMTERRAQALKLRIEGNNYRQIAKELDVSVSTAHDYVMTALAELREQTHQRAEELQALELQRLDEMLVAIWPRKNKPTGVAAILRIMERRAKMLGTDAPVDMRLGGIPGSAPIATTSGLDLSKLSLDQLIQLHGIYETAGGGPAGALAAAPDAVGLAQRPNPDILPTTST